MHNYRITVRGLLAVTGIFLASLVHAGDIVVVMWPGAAPLSNGAR
jgi:hypothetical protein